MTHTFGAYFSPTGGTKRALEAVCGLLGGESESFPLTGPDKKEKTFGPEELLVVDDLKPGHDMARAAGVPFAAAGWANDIPEIEQFMRKNCDHYCKQVSDLARLLEEA